MFRQGKLFVMIVSLVAISLPIATPADGSTLQGQPVSSKKAKREHRGAGKMPATRVVGESAAARQTKGTSAGLEIGSPVLPILDGVGASGTRMFSNSLQLFARINSAQSDLKSQLQDEIEETSNAYADKFILSANFFGGGVRYFLGNSFYVQGSAGLRQINFDFKVSNRNDSQEYIVGSVKTNSGVVSFGVGNQWQWQSGFVLGVEWVGYTQPVSSNYKATTESSGAVSADIESIQADAEKIAKGTSEIGSLYIGLVYLGWAF